LKLNVNDLNTLTKSLSAGTGSGEARLMAFSTERLNSSFPLQLTVESITVPSEVSLTFTVHLEPDDPGGAIQLR